MINIEVYKEFCRARYGRVTPYRLGVTIGRLTDGDYENPYKAGGNASMNYTEGFSVGVIKKIYEN